MKIKCFLIAVCGICLFATAKATKPDSINPNTLEGVWVLDNLELYKYSDNDSVKVSNNLLPEDNMISGVFDTITFSGDKCISTINTQTIEASFSIESNILKLNFVPNPHTYTVIGYNQQIALFRQYYYFNNEVNTLYVVKLVYSKQSQLIQL
jgi:hypothetical protein